MMAGTAGVRFSTWVMSRASANRSPARIRSTSVSASGRRGDVASDPAIGLEAAGLYQKGAGRPDPPRRLGHCVRTKTRSVAIWISLATLRKRS